MKANFEFTINSENIEADIFIIIGYWGTVVNPINAALEQIICRHNKFTIKISNCDQRYAIENTGTFGFDYGIEYWPIAYMMKSIPNDIVNFNKLIKQYEKIKISIQIESDN